MQFLMLIRIANNDDYENASHEQQRGANQQAQPCEPGAIGAYTGTAHAQILSSLCGKTREL